MVVGIALFPAIVLLVFIYFQDKYEKEPIGLLLKIFVLGVLSAAPTMLVELVMNKVIDVTFGGLDILYHLITAFFGVAVIEEFFKFMAAYLLTWRNKHFNYKFDGIVYCLFGSMGFAAIENVLYLCRVRDEYLISMGISRGLLAIPAHAMCAIFMGYYYGNAKYAKSLGDRRGCRRNLITGFLVASSLHAFYDFCIMTGRVFFLLLFCVFVVVADVFTIIRIIKAKKENQKMYEAPTYRQYWVDPYQTLGGYDAPSYGGYATANINSGISSVQQQGAGMPQSQSLYQPGDMMGQQEYQPGNMMDQSRYQPGGMMGQAPYGSQGGSPYRPNPQNQPGNMMGQPMQPNASMGQAPYGSQGGSPYRPNTQMGHQENQIGQPGYQPGNTMGQPMQPNSQMGQPPVSGLRYNDPSNRQENLDPQAAEMKRNMMLHCPSCGAICNFNAFNCSACGAPLHQIG